MSVLRRLFRLDRHHTSVKTELIAGVTIFSTLAYAIVMIPTTLALTGMDFGAVMTATLLAGAFATLFMGLFANYPFAVAPGIALTIYFTYAVVLSRGHDWRAALGVVFLCGALFFILTLLGIRQRVIESIPASLRLATMAGLGIFLALIGLKNAGIIVDDPKTLFGIGTLTSGATLMTLIGILATATLLAFRIPGSLFLGIILLWTLSLIFGLTHYEGIIALPASLRPTLFALDVRGVFNWELVGVALSFFFMSLFDTSGTLVALAEEGDFLEKGSAERCSFPRLSRALTPDATGSMLAGILGTTTMAFYVESAAGISTGGRTGLTSVVVGLLFLAALFFSPFAASVPLFATTPALIIVGGMMMKKIGRLAWGDPTEWIPAFATLVIIPLTSSVATGLGAGFIVYPLIKLFAGRAKEVSLLTWLIGLLFLLRFLFLPVL